MPYLFNHSKRHLVLPHVKIIFPVVDEQSSPRAKMRFAHSFKGSILPSGTVNLCSLQYCIPSVDVLHFCTTPHHIHSFYTMKWHWPKFELFRTLGRLKNPTRLSLHLLHITLFMLWTSGQCILLHEVTKWNPQINLPLTCTEVSLKVDFCVTETVHL